MNIYLIAGLLAGAAVIAAVVIATRRANAPMHVDMAGIPARLYEADKRQGFAA
jgi:hypothetical protein